jgi:predicted permease
VPEILLAVAPVFLLILLGHGLRRFGLLGEAFWDGAERLTYFVLLPALLLSTLAEASLGGLTVLPMAAAIVVTILAGAALLILLRRVFTLEGAAFTSLFQGALRQNTYIGLALAAALFGPMGLGAAALAVALTVPLVNLLSVAALARHGSQAAPSLPGTLKRILRNPLILACLLGIAVNQAGLGLPPVIEPLIAILGRGALPLGLLAVGAGLRLGAGTGDGRELALACGLKLALMPLLAALACWGFGASGVAASVAVLFNGLPAATSSYILARQLGGDAPLMARIITLQTALSIGSLPLVLILLT